MAQSGGTAQRLFLALWPDDDTRIRLANVGQGLAAAEGRIVAPHNLHVTLVFLGNVEPVRRACIERVTAAVRAGAFELAFTHIEWRRKTGIVWLATEEIPAALLEFVASLRTGLSACGYVAERRPFRVHVTLARDVRKAPPLQTISPIHWIVREFSLVVSQPTAKGSQYVVAARWPLA